MPESKGHFPKDSASSIIIGQCACMVAIQEVISKVAPENVPVLITGETGTGKELIARALHRQSSRGDKPFIAVNCAAIPENLMENELLGHEKGAYTGAISMQKGRFERAHGGTLFLDEIGDLSLPLQAKLLRVLEEMTIERLGGDRSIAVDVRVLSATNKDLEKGIEDGAFRKDLFFRLAIIPIEIPPLRERKDDIHLLMDHFLNQYGKKNGGGRPRLSYAAHQALMGYTYPGNIRELQSIIIRAAIFAENGVITLQQIPRRVSSFTYGEGVDMEGRNVQSSLLFQDLKAVTITDKKGIPKKWHRTLKAVRLEDLYNFFLGREGQWFSRKELARFLQSKTTAETSRDATAGRYLTVLTGRAICVHNGKKANLSRYRLSDKYLKPFPKTAWTQLVGQPEGQNKL
ncbi:MAG: sigma-54 dependent transcriptional regulator [Thermodesulfobacteriota bacterium]|nr:sigma-54 dependent transcriptional regulator [Thermodesulfobacteriota bacterium]